MQLVKHFVVLKPDLKLVSKQMRWKTPSVEKAQSKQCRSSYKQGVKELSLLPWDTKIVFVKGKGECTWVTFDFLGITDLRFTDSYPMKSMKNILDWLGSKRAFSAFDFKNNLFRVELPSASNGAWQYGQCLNFSSTSPLYNSWKAPQPHISAFPTAFCRTARRWVSLLLSKTTAFGPQQRKTSLLLGRPF